MTQTLTTDELRQIVETDHTQCGDAAAMARELLANREAQPVAVTQFTPIADLYAVRIFDNGSAYVRDAAEALRISKRNDNAEIVEYVHIKRLQDSYTAPPAPAVPDNLAAAVNRLLDSDGSRGCFSAIRCSDAREEVERLLAQPVRQRYKLPADWRLDESTGAKILMYKDCSVIEDQQAEYVLSLIRSATAAPDAVDIFADQVIGTKTKIIHMPAPLNVPQEGIRVYLNADELFMQLENQGYIVEVSNE
jgi:hypothetical protein